MDADRKIVEAALAPAMAAPLIAIVREYRWVDVCAAADMRVEGGVWLGGWIMRDSIEYGLAEHIDAMRRAIHAHIDAADAPAPFKAAIVAGLGDSKAAARHFTRHMKEKNYDVGAAIWNLIAMLHETRGGNHMGLVMISMDVRAASFDVSRKWGARLM